ncbi:MAG: adenylate/guanylate cyclase domain-containing protein [Candidatus Binataceae bacterium]
MQCAACGDENPAGMKFCGNCAAPLRNRCPRCGFDNPQTFKFCGECAAPLGAGSPVRSAGAPAVAPAAGAIVSVNPESVASTADAQDGERKTVTALFADIKGSMDLIEDLDPEQARAIVDPALVLMIDAVHRYEGYIVQSTGDGVVALFGAPIAHEDHPQRALYAALRMQEDLRKYAARLRAAGNPLVEIRIGINTGEALIRSIRTDAEHTEYTPIGHSMSLAARMQTLAPSGSIVIAQETARMAAGYFELKALGAARIKGVSDPIEVYEVVGLGPLRTRLQRSASRGFSRFVGRVAELEQMKRIAALAGAGHGQIIAAVADAGVGKSRLFYEFKQTSQSGWLVLEAVSVSHGRASAYLPLIDLLRGYFRIASADDDRSRREKITGKVLALDRALEDALAYVFALLGVAGAESAMEGMDAGVRRRRTQDAVKRILLRESLNQPLMIVFEDLHWIDAETQALLNLLADSIATARVLILVNYRPTYRHEWSARAHYTQLRLDPLGPDNARELLDALVGAGAALAPIKDLVIARTEGNPFFMEEMAQTLFEQGVLARGASGEVTIAKPLHGIQIPATVKGILAARIDRLPAAQKDLLQTLSVIGKEFHLQLVRRVTRIDDDLLATMLAELQAAEFIYEQPALPDVEYTFKHALTQEVAYDSVLRERRRAIHERTAAAFEELYAAQIEDCLPELANHYGKSGNIDKAIDYFERAAVQGRERSAYDDAIRNINSAIELLAGTPDSPARTRRQLAFYTELGTMLVAVRGFASPELQPILARAGELLGKVGDSPEIFPVIIGLWGAEFARGRLFEARALAERLMALARQAGFPIAIAGAASAMGATSFWSGDLSTARENLEIAVEIYNSDLETFLPLPNVAVVPSRCQLSWLLWVTGYPDQCVARMAEARALAERLGRPHSIAMALQFAIAVSGLTGAARDIQVNCQALLEISRTHGFPQWIGAGEMSLGTQLIESGNAEHGFPLLRRGLEELRNAGGDLVYRYGLVLLADACLAAGKFDEGIAAIDECASYLETEGERMYEAELLRLRGELIFQNSGDHPAAEQLFRNAISVARTQGAKSWELKAATTLAHLLAAAGRRAEARDTLAPVYAWFTEGFSTRDLIVAKSLLDTLGG